MPSNLRQTSKGFRSNALQILVFLGMAWLSGCASQASDEVPPDAITPEPPTAANETWYFATGSEGHVLETEDGPETLGGSQTYISADPRSHRIGIFHAVAPTNGFGNETSIAASITYSCENSGPMSFGIALYANDTLVAEGAASDFFVGTFFPAVFVQTLDFALVQKGPVPMGSILHADLHNEGCAYLALGGGRWASTISIEGLHSA